MTGGQVLAVLKSRGVVLEPHGDKLHFRAPIGVLTPELRQAVVENKAEILAHLHDCTAGPDLPFPIGYAGLPRAQVEAAEVVMDKWGITDPIMRKYNVLSWVRGFYQDRRENHGKRYEAIKAEQLRLGRILDPYSDSQGPGSV